MQNSRSLQAGILILAAACFARGQVRAAAPARCADLARLTIPGITITAEELPAGSGLPGAGSGAATLPAYCRIVALARPTPQSTINFEVWIPAASAWNGKFQ